jgi:tripartite-type tricarboxylate transporter receptor subunit TctC
MIIPFAAGGPTDVLGRIVGARMSELLGQQIVIENVGGAGGQTGSKRVVDAKPDGYTIGIGTVGTHAQGQTLYKRPLYNSQTDVQPVALLAQVPILLTVRKDLPAKDLKEFVAYAKANQDKMNFGSAGAGSATHLGCVLLNHLMGTKINHIPFRGTGPALCQTKLFFFLGEQLGVFNSYSRLLGNCITQSDFRPRIFTPAPTFPKVGMAHDLSLYHQGNDHD